MIGALKFSGLEQLVFAGGDPSLRADLLQLVHEANRLALKVEIQTNAQFVSKQFLSCLERADLIGLSLDSCIPKLHDSVRGRPGNFRKVIKLANHLDSLQKEFVVRSLVSATTAPGILELGRVLSEFRYLKRWSLVQFSPVEDGWRNRESHLMQSEEFLAVSKLAAANYVDGGLVDIYPNERKAKVYFLIGSNGDVYENVSGLAAETYLVAGNILTSHMGDLVDRAGTSGSANSQRYGDLL